MSAPLEIIQVADATSILDGTHTVSPIRIFSDAALQASIDTLLASLPADHRAAAVDVDADARGIRAVAVVRLDGGWSVMGALDRRFSGEWGGKVQVRWSGR